jgi:AbrB family looped-hinge helix DNA binding protein
MALKRVERTMATDESPEETKVSDRGMVTIPAAIRRRLDIDAGDKLRWTVNEDGTLSVEVVEQRSGAFDDFEAEPMGGDSLETHDSMGVEHEIVESEEQ